MTANSATRRTKPRPYIPLHAIRLRLRPGTTAALLTLAKRNRRTPSAEMQAALDAHLAGKGAPR